MTNPNLTATLSPPSGQGKAPACANTRGMADHLVRGIDVFKSTRYARLAVRIWAGVARLVERRLTGAYDRLVDRESDWCS